MPVSISKFLNFDLLNFFLGVGSPRNFETSFGYSFSRPIPAISMDHVLRLWVTTLGVGPQILMGGRPPQILDPIFKIAPISDHLSYKGFLSVEPSRRSFGKRKKERKFCSKTEYLRPLLRVGGGITTRSEEQVTHAAASIAQGELNEAADWVLVAWTAADITNDVSYRRIAQSSAGISSIFLPRDAMIASVSLSHFVFKICMSLKIWG